MVKIALVSVAESNWCWLCTWATPYVRPARASAELKTSFLILRARLKIAVAVALDKVARPSEGTMRLKIGLRFVIFRGAHGLRILHVFSSPFFR